MSLIINSNNIKNVNNRNTITSTKQTYTSGNAMFFIPQGVTQMTVKLWGASGAGSSSGDVSTTSGAGGCSIITVLVNYNESWYISCGKAGQRGSTSNGSTTLKGGNGSGNSTTGVGGGGDGSLLVKITDSGLLVYAIAGGGGGQGATSSTANGGGGGGSSGENGGGSLPPNGGSNGTGGSGGSGTNPVAGSNAILLSNTLEGLGGYGANTVSLGSGGGGGGGYGGGGSANLSGGGGGGGYVVSVGNDVLSSITYPTIRTNGVSTVPNNTDFDYVAPAGAPVDKTASFGKNGRVVVIFGSYYMSKTPSLFTDYNTPASTTNENMPLNYFSITSLSADNTNVTTKNASTLYIEGAPIASTNQTITNRYALDVGSGTSIFRGLITSTAQPFSAREHTTTQNINNATSTIVLFGTEIMTQQSSFITYNAGSFTIANDDLWSGVYYISYSFTYAANATGIRQSWIDISTLSSRRYGYLTLSNATGPQITSLSSSTVVYIPKNSVIRVYTWQNSTVTLSTNVDSPSYFSIYKLP